MKAAYVCEQGINIETAPPGYRDQAKPVLRGSKIVGWVIPEGTVVEGDEALFRVKTGQAAPIDEECSKACGMDAAQLAVAQRRYQAASKGIQGKKDFELYMAGVIDGYGPGTTDEKPVYIPGPNWKAFQDAKAAANKEEEI